MGAVKSMLCFGAYENGGECGSCPLALVCIDMTLENDGVYDKQASAEELAWLYEYDGGDFN